MPSTRQFRSIGLVTALVLCIIYYVYNGASNTYDSDFYRRTKAAIERKQPPAGRDHLYADEKDRLSRVERVRKEHDAAVEHGGTKVTTSQSVEAAVTEVVGGEKRIKGQKPLLKEQGKVVQGAPEKDSDDGVAKVGNVRKPSTETSAVTEGEDEAAAAKKKKDEAEVEAELNDILRKGPIIVFSKSYCPHSKKAKHILLDLYSITPAPYVVELDTHPLGPGLQNHLHKSTGRRTVPNVLINGRSIGGGDDVAGLHETGKLIDTITSMGGKRIMSATKKEPPAAPHAGRFGS